MYVDTVDIYTEKYMSSPLHGLLSPLLLQLIAVKKCHEMGFTADPGHGVLLTADTANCELGKANPYLFLCFDHSLFAFSCTLTEFPRN